MASGLRKIISTGPDQRSSRVKPSTTTTIAIATETSLATIIEIEKIIA